MKVLQEILNTRMFSGNVSIIHIVNTLVGYTNAFILMLIVIQIFNIKKDKQSISKYLIISAILYIIQKIAIMEPYSKITVMITMTILLNKVFKVKIVKSIFIQTIIAIIVGIIEIPFMKIYYQIYNIEGFYKAMRVPIYELSLSLTILPILGISYLVTKKLNISVSLLESKTKKDYIKSSIFLIAGVSIIYIQLLEIQNLDKFKLIKLSALNIISILLFYYICMNNIAKTWKIKDANLHIDNLEGYNKNLTVVNDSLRGFKHDFNNIIQAMNGYIMLEDIESLKNYFDELLEECNNVKTIEKLNPEIINNPAIYSILINKYQIAEKYNIKMNIDSLLDFEFIHENIYDISRMLGILLDNAIEATSDCEEKLVNIQFCKANKKKYLIIIENTYSDIAIDTEKIFQKNYTTKKERGNTGLGLWEVRKILSKNTGLDLYTTKNNKIFRQQLEIYQ